MQKNKDNNKTNLYQRIDESIMRGVNKTVKAWNWTTGYTKADLANTMLYTALILQSTGFAVKKEVAPAVVCATIALNTITKWAKYNKDVERLEKNAINDGALSPKAENYKDACKIVAPVMLGTCVPTATISAIKGNVGFEMLFGAMGLITAPSFYVMRADYIPPQKSVFARGVDKARGLLRRPVIQPLPAPASYGSVIRT
jgi:hypothetical protein